MMATNRLPEWGSWWNLPNGRYEGRELTTAGLNGWPQITHRAYRLKSDHTNSRAAATARAEKQVDDLCRAWLARNKPSRKVGAKKTGGRSK